MSTKLSRTSLSKMEPARFGEKLKSLRIKRAMTLKEVATALGHRAHGYISELETGKKQPTVEFVLRASKLFGVTTDELLLDDLELRR